MEKIQFGESDQRYPIESIQPVALHIMRIIYAEEVPEESAYSEPMTLYSNGDVMESTLTGWETVYYSDGQTVYLSDDGSVWTEPEETEPEPEEPYEPSIEELRSYKVSEMQSTSDRTIAEGIDVTISDGTTGHYSLTTENRLDLMVREFEVERVVDEIPYHADGEPSRYYYVEDMAKIINAAHEFIAFHETYCNELCLWIMTLEDAEEIESVYYGMDIPEANRSEVLEKMLPVGDDETGMIPQDEPDDGNDDSDDDSGNTGAGGELDAQEGSDGIH